MVRAGQALVIAALLSGCADTNWLPKPPQASSSEAVQVARAAYEGGDYSQAATLFERASQKDLKSVPALLGLGKSYIALGQHVRAENALDRARDLAPRNTEVLTELGFLALSQKQPRRAITFYDAALTHDAHNLSALTGKAVSLDFLSRYAEAQEVYQQALKWYPTNFALLSNYGLSQVLSGKIGEGIRVLEELVHDPVKGNAVRQNMALAYVLDGRDADARAILAGSMSDADAASKIAYYRKVRVDYNAGKPIGYLVFN
ncbi:tetratricopeptide repeat protein [Thioclava electrotropha]|uniref:Tetratricopeptide repeat protein n=1 Tax=Thioclava electrotropha TaxID=1549850 RepID=A0ABX6Z050_9RHOB|nr:tetratricopeptide repeat protein [Thioclava electrotropha]QPZ93361.1 tetratricopeptide repeat protein [Thioclava electrotropha]